MLLDACLIVHGSWLRLMTKGSGLTPEPGAAWTWNQTQVASSFKHQCKEMVRGLYVALSDPKAELPGCLKALATHRIPKDCVNQRIAQPVFSWLSIVAPCSDLLVNCCSIVVHCCSIVAPLFISFQGRPLLLLANC